MRRPNRSSIVICLSALAILQLSCGREVTGPGNGRIALIALDPQMPAISASLQSANGISSVAPFDRVRITATRSDESTVYDRTVPFPSTADSISLSVSIPLESSSNTAGGSSEGSVVGIQLAYINAQGDTIFRGGPVSAFVSASSSGQTVSMPLSYTGIGSNATKVTLTPDTGTVLSGTSTTFVGTALDSLTPIPGTPLLYYTPDTASALIANPAVPTVQWRAKRATARIIALHPSGLLADTSLVNVTLPATKLVVASGASQTALGSTALPAPIVVRTLAADDVPVAGIVVDFAVATGGGSLTVVKDTSDANGEVSTNWTLGTLIGTQSITASAPGLTPSPLTIGAAATAGPTGITLNITSPIGASRYYAIVDGGGLPTEIIGKIDAGYARTTTLTVPVPAGTGYTVYVLAADSLSVLPDTLPTVSAGMKLANINIPAGNTITLPVTLQGISVVGSAPSVVNAGEAFIGDVTLTDPSGLFFDIFTFLNLYRSDTLVAADRGGSAVQVGGMQVLSATQKRFTASVFRPTAAGVIYSQYGGGVASSDRKVIFYVVGPSLQRNENFLVTTVAASNSGIRVNITAPATVTRFVVAVDTGAGPIAWGGVTGAGTTTASIEVPVPPGTNYRVRVAGLQDFNFSQLTLAFLAGLRSGGVLTGQVVSAGITDVNLTLAAQTAAAGVPASGTVGVAIPFSGTMRDPSLFNAAAACLMRYSTTGAISAVNLGTLLTTGCTISNRQADGTFTVSGSFPAVPVAGQLDTHVFTSVIGYTASGARVEMVHQSIAITIINP